MSSNDSANQHRNLRYDQRVKEDAGQYKEREVAIYSCNADFIRDTQNNFQSQEGGPQTKNKRKFLRGAALCLGVLCLLMMAVIIFLSINCDISKLEEEIKKLKIKTKECPEGWKRFGCSCYFKSTGKRKWSDSRTDCENRGSDLVIINSKEEQDFITDFNKNEESWIGLQTTENKTASTGYRWEWVDDSPLTEMFWATAELGNATGLNVASCCDQQGKWTRSGYNDNVSRNWICEKKISCFL